MLNPHLHFLEYTYKICTVITFIIAITMFFLRQAQIFSYDCTKIINSVDRMSILNSYLLEEIVKSNVLDTRGIYFCIAWYANDDAKVGFGVLRK